MQRDSPAFLLPNTFRDSNEIPPARQELILPSAPNIDEMDFNTEPRHSIIRPVEPDNSLSSHNDPPNQNRATNKPLVRSIIRSNASDDERSEPEPHSNGNLINENQNSLSEASGFNPNAFDGLDADAAYALQLQQEEYSRDSLLSSRQRNLPFRIEVDDDSSDVNPALFVEPDTPRFTNDEEYAAYLQEQENRTRQRYRQAPFPFQPIRRGSNLASSQTSETDESENNPSPLVRFSQRQPVDDDDDDDENPHMNGAHAFLQFLASAGHPMPEGFPVFFPGMRRGRRTGNLQDTEEDFGPEDYERLLQLDDAIHKKKLSKHQINTVQEIKFQPKADNTDEENKCGVCLELFEENDPLRQFPCNHAYHKDCADRWLQENNVCPICRKPPVQTHSSSTSRSHRGMHNPRRPPPPMSNRSSSNRNNNNPPTNPNNTHRRGPAPHRQS